MTGSHSIPLARLGRAKDHAVDLRPESDDLAAIAHRLDLSALRKLRFEGALRPEGKRDWVLEGHLGATVVQPCVATLEPVTTRIEQPVLRRYSAGFETVDAEEAEMPDDETLEPLPEELDLAATVVEALALALPLYPRADTAPEEAQIFGPPGVAPMTDEDAKPMAGLAALRDKLAGETPPDEGSKD